MQPFRPPVLLRNPHLQSILASTGPRKPLARLRARRLRSVARTELLACSDGVRLAGQYSAQSGPSKGLAILLHGWEGCAESLYLLSAGSRLFASGYDVFRLNLRDHGPTHHLNRELFNSTRLQEVIDAVRLVQQHHASARNFLVGFSLGGNFALRIAARAPAAGIGLDQVVAVCPVLNPRKTMDALETGWWVYHRYFVRKWQRSLRRKLEHFPELGYGDELLKLKTLRAMNGYFVPRYTEFPDTRSYLDGYSLLGDTLRDLQVPVQLITSRDDPMILAEDLAALPRNNALTIELTEHGGHCGFIENWRLQSWVDRRILALCDAARGHDSPPPAARSADETSTARP